MEPTLKYKTQRSKKFGDLHTYEELIGFALGGLSRIRTKINGTEYVSIYSSVDKLASICNTHTLWLRSAEKMNDRYEFELGDKEFWNKNYFICFSNQGQEDSIGMWSMYSGKPWEKGVILRIPVYAIRKLISDGPKAHPVKGSFVQKESTIEYTKLYSSSVLYIGLNGAINSTSVKNKNFKDEFKSKQGNMLFRKIPGILKWGCWDYEKEIRLFINRKDKPFYEDAIAIELPDGFLESCLVVKSPLFDEKNKEMSEVKKIIPENSIISSFYFGKINNNHLSPNVGEA